jgi:hypothetical protein
MKLASRRPALLPVRVAVDDHRTRAANSFAAIVIERYRFFPLRNEIFIEHIHHLEKGHVRIDLRVLVLDHAADMIRTFLPPNVKSQFHYL